MRTVLLFVSTAAFIFSYTSASASKLEISAGKAISQLLQEKISMKFKEAANEVKGVLVKHLGDSLKNAHNKMNPKKKKKVLKALAAHGIPSSGKLPHLKGKRDKCNEECRLKKLGHRAKCHMCRAHFEISSHQGGAVHQNKGARHRKNKGTLLPGGKGPNANGQAPAPYPLPGASSPIASRPQTQGPNGQPNPPAAAAAPAGQCGGQCSPSCAPTCNNSCCQIASVPQPVCPPSCYSTCSSYCPTGCCHRKK